MRKVELLVPVALALCFGCDLDFASKPSAGNASAAYREAMANYTAGRLPQAIKGLGKVVEDDPSNAAARFQLACLQHETGSDYLEAVCNYREYQRLEPQSDKTATAKRRHDACLPLLAAQLSARYGMTNRVVSVDDSNLVAANARIAGLDKKVVELEHTISTLTAENSRLRHLVGSLGTDDDLSEMAEAASGDDLSEDDTSEIVDRGDVKKVKDEAETEMSEAGASSALLPPAPQTVKANDPADGKPKAPVLMHEEKPEYYVVREGDTLYRIALRFYGRTAAWREIRAANKAVISPDGRVKVGQKLRLP